MTAKKELRGFVDRIEGDKAVVLVGEHEQWTLVVAKDLLPEGAGEGSVLRITIRCDAKQTAEAAQQVSESIDKLTHRGDT
ncbi:MAG TPA: DUF3006 domain-containing protein [Armatimonadota bacterium]|nr:DUF3006 domain-containing protein [Armatimonadota bacterium]